MWFVSIIHELPAWAGLGARWLLALLMMATPAAASAATATWDGGDADDSLWTSGDNWVGNIAPVAGDALVFSGGTRLAPSNDFPADTSFASITFAGGAGAFVLGGNRLALTGNVTNSGTTTQTVGLAMVMAATRTFSTANGSLSVGDVLSGAGGLTKSSAGTLTLTATNTYAGATTVSAGTLRFAKRRGAQPQQGVDGNLQLERRQYLCRHHDGVRRHPAHQRIATTGQALVSGVRSGLTSDLELYLRLPTVISAGGGSPQTITVTITATLPP